MDLDPTPKEDIHQIEGAQETEIAEASPNIGKTEIEEVKVSSYYDTIGYYTGWWGATTEVAEEEQKPPKTEATPAEVKLAAISEEELIVSLGESSCIVNRAPTDETLTNTKEEQLPEILEFQMQSHFGLPMGMEKTNSENITVRELKLTSQRNL